MSYICLRENDNCYHQISSLIAASGRTEPLSDSEKEFVAIRVSEIFRTTETIHISKSSYDLVLRVHGAGIKKVINIKDRLVYMRLCDYCDYFRSNYRDQLRYDPTSYVWSETSKPMVVSSSPSDATLKSRDIQIDVNINKCDVSSFDDDKTLLVVKKYLSECRLSRVFIIIRKQIRIPLNSNEFFSKKNSEQSQTDFKFRRKLFEIGKKNNWTNKIMFGDYDSRIEYIKK